MNSIKNILERRSERNYKNIPIEQEKINKLSEQSFFGGWNYFCHLRDISI